MTVASTSGAMGRVTCMRSPKRAFSSSRYRSMAVQFLGQRGEVPVPAEGVAGEVGELHHQLPGPGGIGVDEGGDRVERVVDEVRADLGPQGPHLGLHQQGAGGVQLGQLHLRGHPGGDLGRRAHQPGAGARDVGADGAHRGVPDHDRGADHVRGLRALDLGAGGGQRGGSKLERRGGAAAPRCPGMVPSTASTAEVSVMTRRLRRKQGAQVLAGGGGTLGGQALGQVRGGDRDRCRVSKVAFSASVPRSRVERAILNPR